MKRMAVLAVVLVALATFVGVAGASSVEIQYREVGPLVLSIGGVKGTVSTDSTARNFNTALTAGAADTTWTYNMPEDIVWGAISDSTPLFVVIRRVGGTGGSADSVQVVLDFNYGGSTFRATHTDAANSFGFSTIANSGTGTDGFLMFKPSTAVTQLLNAINTYTVPPFSYGATQFRMIARSISVAASAGRYSLYLRYPAKSR